MCGPSWEVIVESELKISKAVEKLARMIVKLEPAEFIGVCKILGVELYTLGESELVSDSEEQNDMNTTVKINQKLEIKEAEELILEVFDKLNSLNRTQRRNLTKLVKSAVKDR